jgi:hypothetical protein
VEGLLEAFLSLVACRGHDRLVVFQRDGLQEDVIHIRVGRAEQRLAAARALGKVEPDNRQAAEVLGGPCHHGLEDGRQHEGCRHEGCPLEEIPPRYPALFQQCLEVFPRRRILLLEVVHVDLALLQQPVVLPAHRFAVIVFPHRTPFRDRSILVTLDLMSPR